MKTQIQGHRGDRGNFPENSIPAFLSAVKKGVDVLEMDVVISKDKKVVVSHEAYIASAYVLQPNGADISKEKERNFNLYDMNYAEIKTFDAGSKINQKFLQQQKLKTYKPLLSEVIETVEKYTQENNLPAVAYNIEIKSEVEFYHKFQPEPKEFVKLVTDVLLEKQIENRVILQSFDVNILEEIHLHFSAFTIAYLVENNSFQQNKERLSFKPEIYSPHFKLLNSKKAVQEIQQEQILVIPWTVNKPEDITKMLDFGVNAIITDFPERALTCLRSRTQTDL
ncbi:glycerophosphodiester phosphodiesterase family protein [Mesonia sp.]|uniref:glycerophosphodiester phosphodiesterase family protein n=1 Tax=Mesonia sp. TaxID=1960830 RepID=UPI001770079B|nr:glycerophosphodiester phosphodiesterase family protein [Mesonia sp.]HIB37096.1 glycerophosphodiester phosphodiesterase [Mesonia sp.]HIO26703.1 glycerophosphodiester phosphodiesterase [Flavobacteriaceae bacterium]